MDFSKLSTYNDFANAHFYIVGRLGHLRDTLPYPDHDVRHVMLGGIQRIVAGYGMGLNSMIFNRSQEQVIESLGESNQPPDELRKAVEDAWRWGISILFHFRIDSLFSSLLYAARQTPSPQFRQKAEALVRFAALASPDAQIGRLLALSYIRNSFHNNGIHQNAPLQIELGGTWFNFVRNEPVQCASWAHMFVVMDAVADVLSDLLHSNAVSELPQPIPDAYAEALRAGRIDD